MAGILLFLGPALGPACWVPLAAGSALAGGYVAWAARRDQPALPALRNTALEY